MAIRNVKLEGILEDPDGTPNSGDEFYSYRYNLLEVPANTRYAVTTIMVCNSYDPAGTNADQQTCVFDMYIVPDGSNPTPDTTVVVRKLAIPAGETFTFDSEKIILGEFDRVVLDGSAPEEPGVELGHLVATVSYLEV